MGGYASASFVDIDGDGDLDAFIGNDDGNTLVYLNITPRPVTTTMGDDSYGIGSVITLQVAFNENVIVSGGVPTLALETGAIDRFATYVSGSGTDTLTFTYTVQAGDSSADLDFKSTAALVLNGSTIQDSAGNNAILTLKAPGTAGSLASNAALVIDGVAPRGTILSPLLVFGPAVVSPYGLDDSGEYADPAVVDIDGDGDLDVFVGNIAGDTLLYLNTGSATLPAFAAALTNPYGLAKAAYVAAPAFVDIDADGDLDAFIGNSFGNIALFLNTGTAGSPAFAAPVDNPYGLVDAGSYGSPSLIDIDSDGDLDVFVGNADGNILVFLNTGNASAPAFAAPATNPYGLGNVGLSAAPSFADVDEDGDLDAFVGDHLGNTLVFLNTGSASTPAFAAPLANAYGLSDVGSLASPSFADIDGDGDLDALIGSSDGNTQVFIDNGKFVAPVASSSPNGAYGQGSVITLTVTFNENVIVNTAGGTPTLKLETGAIDRFASYSAGSGTRTLSFEYTVQAGDSSADLENFNSAALALKGGTIRDAAGNDAILTLAPRGAQGSLSGNAALVVDGIAPTLAITSNLAALAGGQAATITFRFSEDPGASFAWNGSSGDVVVTGGTLSAIGGSGLVRTAAFTATPGIAAGTASISVAAALYTDAVGNMGSAGASLSLSFDTLAPTLAITSSVSTLSAGETALITFTFSEDPGTSFVWNGNSGDVLVTGGKLGAISGSGLVRTATFTPTAGIAAGSASITVAADRYTDAAGNKGGAGATPSLSYDTLHISYTGNVSNEKASGGTSADTLDGAGGDDTLYGLAGNDSLTGGDGQDVLIGGLGADTMKGGNGKDSYYLDDAGDVVIETNPDSSTGGVDTAYSYLGTYTLGSNIERGVIKAASAANLTGNAQDNALHGNASANELQGLDGNDQLLGNAGNDHLLDDAGNDSLYGGDGSDRLEGGSGEDLLDGGTGKDWLDAGEGNDSLHGGAENDWLDGGDGDDWLDGGEGSDWLEGGTGKDTLTGSSSDILSGGDGDDLYHVYGAGNVVIESSAGTATGGVDAVYSYLSAYTLTDDVENGLIKTSATASLTGNELDNSLYGNTGNDSLNGGVGDDTLAGKAGADQLTGGAGRDVLTGGTGADTFIFESGSGRDYIQDFSQADGDIVRLQGNLNGSGITDAASALAHVSDKWGSAVLDLGDGNVVRLTGIMTADLTLADFMVF